MSTTDQSDGPPPTRADRMLSHAEGSISEDAIVAAARERAADAGAGAVTPAVGALLSLLARLAGGKAVVEVGTGAGVSGLWLLAGMREDGVLTTIDIEPEHQQLAKQAFTEAKVAPGRTRVIAGRAQEVLTRLADESYDLVFVDAAPVDQGHFVGEGVRLLRPAASSWYTVPRLRDAQATRPPTTPRWPRSGRRRGSSPKTSASPRCWCHWATGC